MKKEFCMMAIGLLLAGCSADEEIANVQTSETNAISFNVVSNNPQTKAELINSATDLQKYPFDIFAFKTDGTLFMGAQDESYTHDGVKISYQGNMWTYTNPAEKKYWPHDPLHFYAVYPVLTAADPRYGNMSWLMNWQNHSISYSAFDEFAEGITAKNVDVMYAIAPYQEKSKNRGIVPLTFKHALSQVLFKAMTEDLTISVAIKNMKIYNVNMRGTFKLPSFSSEGVIEPVDNTAWISSIPYHYTIGMNESPLNVLHAGIDISSGDKAMLFIPQYLKPWNPHNGDISVADGNKESYLQIKCKIWHNDHYFVGNKNEYKDIYVPFKADWQPGKRYIYTLKFGGGYTEDGKEIDLMPITFSASVENWDDASGDEIKHPDL